MSLSGDGGLAVPNLSPKFERYSQLAATTASLTRWAMVALKAIAPRRFCPLALAPRGLVRSAARVAHSHHAAERLIKARSPHGPTRHAPSPRPRLVCVDRLNVAEEKWPGPNCQVHVSTNDLAYLHLCGGKGLGEFIGAMMIHF